MSKISLPSGFQPKKSLSQNFLHSAQWQQTIVSVMAIEAGDNVLEVGPGTGLLTAELLHKGAKVWGIEKDRKLVCYLQQLFLGQPLTVIEQDVLTFSFPQFFAAQFDQAKSSKFKLLANLPYHITSPFLFLLYDHRHYFEKIFILLQKEVAQRFQAKIGQDAAKHLSVIGLLGELGFVFEQSFVVSKQNFFPVPKVDSMGLVFRPIADQVPRAFFDFAKNIYSSRRKIWKNNVYWRSLNIAESETEDIAENFWYKRPEEISLQTWKQLFALFEQKFLAAS